LRNGNKKNLCALCELERSVRDTKMRKDSKIYIAGHTGLVGSALVRGLQAAGFANLVFESSSRLDLTRQADTEKFFQKQKPEYVFLAAAKVGGILANNTYPAAFIYSNLAIQTNVIHAAWQTGVKRLFFLGSSCIYPKACPQPMKESYLLTGPLEPTNEPYAIAKIAGLKMCQSYNRQYGTTYAGLMPTNLYGPNDNFDLEDSHVLPALIRKFHLAKLASGGHWDAIEKDETIFGPIPDEVKRSLGLDLQSSNRNHLKPTVVLWGSGAPRREFLHVDDLAGACIFIASLNDADHHTFFERIEVPLINVGCGQDQTIKALAEIIAEVVGFQGEISWDQDKPDGTPQKLLDVSIITKLGWKPTIALKDGIQSVYQWYLQKAQTE
jgi:GDP-L-fucose synthase